MTALRALQREAEIRARVLGHELGEWKDIPLLEQSAAICKHCDKTAFISTHSFIIPFLIGSATWMNCN